MQFEIKCTCKDCKHRHSESCPMYFEYMENWYTEDDGYDYDLIEVDNTSDNNFCMYAEEGEFDDEDKKEKHGKWITHNENNPFEIYGECSNCHFEQTISKKLNFCPNCGAKMDSN